MNNYVNRYMWRKILLACLVGFCLSQITHAANPFIRVRIAHGVSLDMPRNWVVLAGNTRITIDAWVAARIKENTRSDLTFAANLYDNHQSVIALLNVRFYPEQTVTQAEIQAATNADINEMDIYMRDEMLKAARLSGFSMLRWNGLRRINVNGISVLAYGYRRSAMPQAENRSPFNVTYYRVLNRHRSFTLTVSYREDQAALVAPICDAILASLRVEGLSRN